MFFVLFLLVLSELPHGPLEKLVATLSLLKSMLVADSSNPNACQSLTPCLARITFALTVLAR